MLTQHPSQETTQAHITTLQSMQQSWLFCPESDLANLFYFESKGNDERVSCFVVDQVKLDFLFSNIDQTKPINIRLHMANDSGIPYGTIEKNMTSFTPIIQVFNTDAIPGNIYTNALIVDKMYDPSLETPDIPITPAQANQMNTAWNHYPKTDLSQLFEAEVGRLNFYTFNESDSNAILTTFNNDPLADKKLFVSLGYFPSLSTQHPFGFRFILNIMTKSPTGIMKEDCFEFSNPCPPAC